MNKAFHQLQVCLGNDFSKKQIKVDRCNVLWSQFVHHSHLSVDKELQAGCRIFYIRRRQYGNAAAFQQSRDTSQKCAGIFQMLITSTETTRPKARKCPVE